MCLCGTSLKAQTVAPLGGLGNIQFFDNNGSPLTAGVLYSYQAGTSTQQATYTDSSGTIQNPNPIPFGSGARVQIWLSIGSFYKFVLCVQNDGAACAAGDILFTVDQVPGGSTSSGGSSSSPFISGTASPATSGILRLATSDTICWRNAAGSTNLCLSKDANDLLSWPTALKLPEISTPSCTAGFDVLWADNSAHNLKTCLNGSSPFVIALNGADLNLNQVIQLHFGATPTPLSGSAPGSGQCLQWNGANIVGASCGDQIWSMGTNAITVNNTASVCPGVGADGCDQKTFATAHTLIRLEYILRTGQVGCAGNQTIGIRDLTSSTTLQSFTLSNGQGNGYLDSGPLVVAMTAGDKFGLGVLATSAGCGTSAVIVGLKATYQ